MDSAPGPQLDLANIPNLPGYGFKRKQKHYGKKQGFQCINGVRVEQEEGVTFEKPKMVMAPAAVDQRRVGSLGETTQIESYKEAGQRTVTQMPAWDALDRHVLRFYGFFKESVVETNLENYRVRHCSVLYYLEDDTCQIIEKKQDNSGIPQGQLIRRHRFPGPDGGYLGWQDLAVGQELNIYGRVIQVVDCDKWTRSYYEQQGMDQAPGEPLEDDNFMRSLVKMGDSVGNPKTADRMYREAQLGGGHVNADMQQFMEWDRKVCRFYAIMDDVSLPQFERRPFVIMFFLSDDSVEVREQYPLNAGRDNFPIFFRRARIKRGNAEVKGPLDDAVRREECVSVEDFSVGEPTMLLGNHFFIYDADPFTRQYFRSELSCELGPAVDVRLPERAVPRPKTPPYTGYGSWEDSLGSVRMLMPKPPRKDFVKLFENDGMVLRFTAQILEPKPEDADRMFVVNFHLYDDTLSIHEPPQRNSGIITGKFLEKAVHTNQMTGDLFKPSDLYPGAQIKVYNRGFELIDMDEFTRNYYENGGSAPRTYDLAAVLEKLRESMRQQFPLARDIFRKFDLDHDGVITMKEFKEAFHKFGFQLAEQEALTIMKHFDARKDGQISYNEFCDALLDQDYTTMVMSTKPPLNEEVDDVYAGKAQARLQERTETDKVRSAARTIGDIIYKRSQNFQRACKEIAHMTHEPCVSVEQLQLALKQLGKIVELEDVRRAVLYVMPDADVSRINYVEFFKAMVTSYHDLSANR